MDLTAIPNQPEKSSSLAVTSCIGVAVRPTSNPFDEFDDALRDFVRRAAKADSDGDSLLIHLIMLGLISQTEVYFRAALCNLIRLCPYCAQKVTKDHVSFAAATYYSPTSLGYALLEHESLADFEKITKQTKRITDFNIGETTSVGAALLEFNKVCAIRHAVVHSGGILSAANLVELDHDRSNPCSVKLTFRSFEEIADICFNAVKAFNRFLFNATLDRWIRRGGMHENWVESKPAFSKLYEAFVSRDGRSNLQGPKRAFTLLVVPRFKEMNTKG